MGGFFSFSLLFSLLLFLFLLLFLLLLLLLLLLLILFLHLLLPTPCSPYRSALLGKDSLGALATLSLPPSLTSSLPPSLPPSTRTRWVHLTTSLLPAMHLFTLWAIVEASIALDLWDGKEGMEEGTEEAARILVEKARTLLPKLVRKAKVRARAMGARGQGERRVEGKVGWVRKEVEEGLRRIEEMMAR
ncbi:hypothetical protein Naga_100250g1 [Nannochloropsis gaditana]|uniref:Uncharacterized protein n=1 Tax=Nannochloropsis gaditana TaxID=72520 RepID=W7T8T3_9STRA|nr:hypothetical protein Naga_100250g1 [Nannochloropsis gaditana]